MTQSLPEEQKSCSFNAAWQQQAWFLAGREGKSNPIETPRVIATSRFVFSLHPQSLSQSAQNWGSPVMFSPTPRLHSPLPSALHHLRTSSASKMSYDTNERQKSWGLISVWFSHLSCTLLWTFFAVPRCLLPVLDDEALPKPLNFYPFSP